MNPVNSYLLQLFIWKLNYVELLTLLLHKSSSFSCGVDDELALMGCYAVYTFSCLMTFEDSVLVLSSRVLDCLTLEDGTDGLSRNVSQQLSTYAEQQRKSVKTPKLLYFRYRANYKMYSVPSGVIWIKGISENSGRTTCWCVIVIKRLNRQSKYNISN
jgi:hypothetical protein